METVFSENQKFRQWWLWLIIFVSSLASIGVPFFLGKIDEQTLGMSIGVSVSILAAWAFYMMELRTRIKKNGIYYQFFPFHFKQKQITWDEIKEMEIIKYNPIGDYGGWGIRFGWKGKAYTVRGNMGLQLEMKSGKKLLIGTQKVAEMQIALDDIQLDQDLEKHSN